MLCILSVWCVCERVCVCLCAVGGGGKNHDTCAIDVRFETRRRSDSASDRTSQAANNRRNSLDSTSSRIKANKDGSVLGLPMFLCESSLLVLLCRYRGGAGDLKEPVYRVIARLSIYTLYYTVKL